MRTKLTMTSDSIIFQKYFFTVKATSSVGDIVMSSDGVVIISDGGVLDGIEIKDGQPCPRTGLYYCPYNDVMQVKMYIYSHDFCKGFNTSNIKELKMELGLLYV